MKGYRCTFCGTGYSSVSNEVPPTPKWADGHECTLTEVNHTYNEEEKHVRGRD